MFEIGCQIEWDAFLHYILKTDCEKIYGVIQCLRMFINKNVREKTWKT